MLHIFMSFVLILFYFWAQKNNNGARSSKKQKREWRREWKCKLLFGLCLHFFWVVCSHVKEDIMCPLLLPVGDHITEFCTEHSTKWKKVDIGSLEMFQEMSSPKKRDTRDIIEFKKKFALRIQNKNKIKSWN